MERYAIVGMAKSHHPVRVFAQCFVPNTTITCFLRLTFVECLIYWPFFMDIALLYPFVFSGAVADEVNACNI